METTDLGTRLKNHNLWLQSGWKRGDRLFLSKETFDGIDFGLCHLNRASIIGCTFTNCRFNGTKLPHGNIRNCRFNGCFMDFAVFEEAFIEDCSFNSCIMENIFMGGCEIDSTEFHECNLFRTKMERARISETRFKKCKAEQLHLCNAEIKSSEFLKCDLQCILSSGCFMQQSKLADCDAGYSIFVKSKIVQSTFTHTNLCHANFEDASIASTGFRCCDTVGISLDGTELVEGTALDFSSFPLWCGSLHAKPDDRLVSQLLFHITSFNRRNMSNDMKNLLKQLDEMGVHLLFQQYRDDLD